MSAPGRQDRARAGHRARAGALYLDLENTDGRQKLSSPALFLKRYPGCGWRGNRSGPGFARSCWSLGDRDQPRAVDQAGQGFLPSLRILQPDKSFVVYAGTERYPVSEDVQAIGILDMANMLLAA